MAELRDSLLRALQAHVDAGRGMGVALVTTACCPDAVEGGPACCTCWTPEYDQPQTDPDPQTVAALALGEAEPPQRRLMCHDCAYRPDSPERNGDEAYDGDAAELDRIAREDRFWCHDGLRKPIAWRHPAGIRIPTVSDGDYQPPVVLGVPYRATGEPGLLCAGWAARRRVLTAVSKEAACG